MGVIDAAVQVGSGHKLMYFSDQRERKKCNCSYSVSKMRPV